MSAASRRQGLAQSAQDSESIYITADTKTDGGIIVAQMMSSRVPGPQKAAPQFRAVLCSVGNETPRSLHVASTYTP